MSSQEEKGAATGEREQRDGEGGSRTLKRSSLRCARISATALPFAIVMCARSWDSLPSGIAQKKANAAVENGTSATVGEGEGEGVYNTVAECVLNALSECIQLRICLDVQLRQPHRLIQSQSFSSFFPTYSLSP